MRQEFRCEVLRHNAPSHFTAASPKPKLMITASTKKGHTEKILSSELSLLQLETDNKCGSPLT